MGAEAERMGGVVMVGASWPVGDAFGALVCCLIRVCELARRHVNPGRSARREKGAAQDSWLFRRSTAARRGFPGIFARGRRAPAEFHKNSGAASAHSIPGGLPAAWTRSVP